MEEFSRDNIDWFVWPVEDELTQEKFDEFCGLFWGDNSISKLHVCKYPLAIGLEKTDD